MQTNEHHVHRDEIHRYLTSLATYLARLDTQESNEVIREIESHIYDAIDLQEQQGEEVNVDTILSRLGAPRLLAEQYVSHITQGTPPPKGMSAIAIVKNTVGKTLFWGTGIFGFLFGSALLVVGFLKLIVPNRVGVWSSANGNSFVVGFVDAPMHQDMELMGMWFGPVAVILGVVVLRITYLLLRALKGTST